MLNDRVTREQMVGGVGSEGPKLNAAILDTGTIEMEELLRKTLRKMRKWRIRKKVRT